MKTWHQFYLNQIQKRTKASFVGWERYRDNFKLKVVVDGKPNYFGLHGSLENITHETYIDLLKSITNE